VIRPATSVDVPRLVAMGERFLTQTVYRGRVTVNPEQMAKLVTTLLEGEIGTIFVSELAGDVVGMIGLLLFTHPIAGEPTVGEVFWWVEPEHRGGGIRLLKRAEQRAREQGAVKIHMIAPTPDVGQLYERLGYEPLEMSYQRAL
jgi:GNAT superfamily N-acetyltransferase